MYQEADLVKIAKREQNKKRTYLVVNRLQGKHIPVSPCNAFQMFDALALLLQKAYPHETLALIGFAETATAIGARLAIQLQSYYMQTTREALPGAAYISFSETHSHAVEQKLVRTDVEAVMERADRIVFVEDEVTTGNTILNIVRILEREYPNRVRFSVASLLNGMEEAACMRYASHKIDLQYLVKTNHANYAKSIEDCLEDGVYAPCDPVMHRPAACESMRAYQDARRLVLGRDYGESCKRLWEQMQKTLSLKEGARVLVLGTEEFMYPSLFIGAKLEECGYTVRCHATTRSPIVVSGAAGYPLQKRYELVSMYQEGRRTFLYELSDYDCVLVLTDAAQPTEQGVASLVNALASCGNAEIRLFRWGEA